MLNFNRRYRRRRRYNSPQGINVLIMVAIAFVLWLLLTFENAEKNLHTENVGTILVIMAVITILILAIFIGYKIVIKKTYTFIQNHSIAIKTLKKLNSEFSFAPVEIIKFENSYDNEAMFDDLHTVDYLVYMLIYEQKRVRKTMESTNQHKYL